MKTVLVVCSIIAFGFTVAACSKSGHPTSAANQAANTAAVSQAAGAAN